MLEKTRRLFEPALQTKITALKEMIEGVVGYLNIDILPILVVPYVIKLLNENNFQYAILICFVAFVGHIILWLLNYLIRSWDFEAKYAMNAYIEARYRKEVLLKDHKSFDVIGTGKVQSIVQKGMDNWAELNWQVIYQIPKLFIGVLTGFYVMLQFETSYLIAFFFLMLCSYLTYGRYKFLRKKAQEKANDVDDVINASSVRSVMSRQEIVFSGKIDREVDNFLRLNEESKGHTLKSDKYDYIANLALEITGPIISFVFVGLILSQHSITGTISSIDIASIIFLIYFASRFIGLMYMTAWIITQILDHLPKIEKFWKFLDETPSLKNYEEGDVFVQKKTSIVFNNVNFMYGEKKILENFSLAISHGQKIALVGKSGSGKTTIAKLVSAYMYPDSGEVLIDGQDTKKVSLKSYYKHIGYLTQEPMIFDGSVKENLLYSFDDMETSSEDVLWDALKRAECDFVTDLNIQIGEKGIRLSGGERQRLAIAKLMLKNPEIVILDEPTSALDSFSEEKITKALDELFIGKTVIIIAHRLQTIKKADKIFVIEEGRVVEEGKHKTLMSKKGTYYRMVELQSGF
jgi:ABC-type multidrug transport system fused ATPase/permease subunit